MISAVFSHMISAVSPPKRFLQNENQFETGVTSYLKGDTSLLFNLILKPIGFIKGRSILVLISNGRIDHSTRFLGPEERPLRRRVLTEEQHAQVNGFKSDGIIAGFPS